MWFEGPEIYKQHLVLNCCIICKWGQNRSIFLLAIDPLEVYPMVLTAFFLGQAPYSSRADTLICILFKGTMTTWGHGPGVPGRRWPTKILRSYKLWFKVYSRQAWSLQFWVIFLVGLTILTDVFCSLKCVKNIVIFLRG